MKQAIILAGGQGSRLRDRLGELPKPMIPIGGRPLLEHQVELARRQGIAELVLFVHHRAEVIQAHFGTGARWGLSIRYVVEPEPRGTAGAVLAGLGELDERFFVLYGDTMVNVDLRRLAQAHARAGAAATLLLHPNDHPLDSDLVEADAAGRITAFHPRPHPANCWRQNLVNAGLYVIEKRALVAFAQAQAHGAGAGRGGPPLDFGKDLFPALLRGGTMLQGYNSPEYIKDIGTPERYDRVCAEFANGTFGRSSLETLQRAVFLDRDGTLVVDRGGLRSAEELELLPGVGQAVRLLNRHGWRAVVVTNQPVLAKGWCTQAELQRTHNKMETLLGQQHAFLDRIYFCPHHPDKGFPGERPELKIVCRCRKPAPGMLERAVAELNLDLAQSWMIGDSTTDVQTARNAGVGAILLRTGAGGLDGKHAVAPDRVCDNLLEAVKFVLETGAPPPSLTASPP